MDRRSFLKASALFGSKFLLGATGLASLTNCGSRSDWRSIQYPKILLDNFRLFNGLNYSLQNGQIVLIEGDKIIGIERKGDLNQYKGFRHFDLNGWTLLPGLIDNHVHITSPFTTTGNLNVLLQKDEQFELNFKNCVMSGVTTVRDVGGFPGMIRKFTERADKNQIPGPRVISSLSMIAAREGTQLGWPMYAPYIEDPTLKRIMGGNFAERPTTVEQINEVCEEMVRLGAVWLKTLHQDQSFHHQACRLPNHTDDGYKAILEKGRKHGIRCAMHAMFVSGFNKGVDLGYHTLEHTPMDAIITDGYADRFAKNDAAIIPTIRIFEDFLIARKLMKLIEARGQEYLSPEALKQVTASLKKILAVDQGDLSDEDRRSLRVDPLYFKDMFPNVIKNIAKLKSAGAKIGIGTDSGSTISLFGLFSDELKYMASAGISNFETLRMATVENADILNMQDRIGTIEKGKWADLIAIEGDPLADLDSMNNVRMVMKGGAFIKSEGIAGLGV
ncbi:MAG: amidohydrolase family protein [Thermodesulfobacteriota bacterium]|nr:amidohydrolase family protein [Thermodesulfobacteriota bacterium]